MKNMKTAICMALLAAILLCGCSAPTEKPGETGNVGPEIKLDAETEALLEALGEDIHVTAPEQFAACVAAFGSDDVGQVYQLNGYYRQNESDAGEADYLTNADASASVQLRYLYAELTPGDCYTVTGIVAEDSHGDHHHLYFDVIAVESYQS